MNTETIEIDGYKVVIAQDESPSNPFEECDYNPPTLTYYERLDGYGNCPDIYELVNMLPDECFARGKRVEFIRGNLKVSLKTFAEERRERYGKNSDRETIAYFLSEQCPEPRSWREAKDYFEMLEWLCGLAGVPCHYTQSNGYSQRDSALVMAFATPEWVKHVGAGGDLSKQCKYACDLYGYWAWGDVYGISEILDPDGNEIPDGSVWGFYGPHKESGLLESAKDSIEYHKKQVIKEAAEAEEMACRDIVTV